MDSYHALVAEVDRLSERLCRRYQRHLTCHPGCSSCCNHHLSVFPVEAAAISQALCGLAGEKRTLLLRQADMVRERESRGDAPACPLLVEDRCAVYAARPIICRTHGLPLMIESEIGELEVDFCPLNFTASGASDDLEEDHLVELERLNTRLAIANLVYLRESRQPQAEPLRIPVADIIQASVGRR